MHITHSYLGTALGSYRCQFYLLLKDYIEAECEYCRKLDGYLERFARNMKDKGALVRPFRADIETTHSHVLEKAWSASEQREITETPGLLMINVDFDVFDPQQHPWLFISLGEHPGSEAFVRILEELAYAVQEAEMDVFQAAREIVRQTPVKETIKIFEAKPGVFGFKVDLIQGAELVKLLYAKVTHGKNVLPATLRSDGWTKCPRCGINFATYSRTSWDGSRHVSCGAYLLFTRDETPKSIIDADHA